MNLSSPEDLSLEIIKLASELEKESEELAEAELEEDKEAVNLMTPKFSGTPSDENIKVIKMSVAESEKRALVNTNNKYHELKYKRDAKIELINAYKARLKVLSWEYEKAGTNNVT